MSLSGSFLALLLAALGVAALAIWAGPNLAVALPAAVGAATLGAVMVLDGWRSGSRAPRGSPGLPTAVTGSGSVPSSGGSLPALDGSRFDREELVLLLDQIDRSVRNPHLPSHRPDDLERIAALPHDAFVAYVRDRVAELEAGS